MESAKERFKRLLMTTERAGIVKTIEWLEASDFFTAPASTRFHGSEKGGLVEHSLEVYKHLTEDPDALEYDLRSLTVVALLHDICKAYYYTETTRNVKDENGKWIQVPYYTVDDKMPYGHGEKSVMILMKLGVDLTEDEIMAIRWHMSGFEPKENYGTMSTAYGMYKLCTLLSCADMKATYLSNK